MNLPDYLFLEPPAGTKGMGFVLYTHPPFYMGKILAIENEDDFYRFKSNLSYPVGCVSGYRVLILPAGVLNDEKDVPEVILAAMAGFYLENKVLTNPYRFKKLFAV